MALINLNDELNVDSDKLEIIQLDEAQFPKHHFFPNFPKIFIFLNAIGLVIVTLILIITKILKDIRLKSFSNS